MDAYGTGLGSGGATRRSAANNDRAIDIRICGSYRRTNEPRGRGTRPIVGRSKHGLHQRRLLSSAKLYYNLANAYFKEEQLSRSILFYRRALRLDPGNADARYNLSVAEARTKDNIERIPEFFLTEWFWSIRRTMGCTGWSILSLIALACGLGLGLLYLLSQRLTLRKTGFYGSLAAAVVFVLTTGFAMGERHTMLDRSEAVVMSSSAAIKSAPDRSATDLFILHEGTTVRITDELDRWCEVTIADGKKGWVERSKIETI